MTTGMAATRYARALFDVARGGQADLEAIGRELAAFHALVSGNAPLQRVATNPAIPAGRKRALVEALLADQQVTPTVSRLLLLLAERDRLVLLPELVAAYRSRLMDHQQVVRAELTTALALGEDKLEGLKQGLAQATGREVSLQVRVDPELVGGAVARVGSTVYDGSVVAQLERLKRRLTQAEG